MPYCYNCERTADHISRNCNLGQRYTRCDVCYCVCSEEANHAVLCTNKEFRSTLIVEKVQQTTMALELYCNQELTHILDGDTLKPLSSDPVLISNAKLLLIKNGLILNFYHVDMDGIVRISVADGNGNNRLRIFADSNKFVVNNSVRLTADGAVTTRAFNNNLVRADLHFISTNVEEFQIRIWKFGSFGFVVGRNNIRVLDRTADPNNGTFVCFFFHGNLYR